MSNKKVVFVEPRGANSNVFARAMTIPLLGPVYLATIAKKAGFDAVVLNENILERNIYRKELASADILCLSCITATVNRGKRIANEYRIQRPDGRVIIGGIHASMLPNDVAPFFDQVVVGEAENIIINVLSGKIKDKIVYAQRPENLDELPIPNFRLVKDWQKIKTLPVMTSRGCPHDCNFCAVTEMFGREYRAQSPERVLKEIMRYKKGKIFFSDDNFTANMTRTNKTLDMMIKKGFDRPWEAQVRTEVTKKPEFVAKMKKAGCNTTYIGFESVNNKSLEDMNKKQTVDDITRSIKVFHDHGIAVHGMFILGNDSDTKDIFRNTSDFCHDNDLDYAQYAVLTPLPGTRAYYKLEKEKRLLHKNWDVYDGLHTVFNPKHMTADELQQGIIECFSDFYSYTRAINSALNAVVDSAMVSVKKLYTNAYFPSLKPALMRFIGKEIIRKWLVYNKNYLSYLSNLAKR